MYQNSSEMECKLVFSHRAYIPRILRYYVCKPPWGWGGLLRFWGLKDFFQKFWGFKGKSILKGILEETRHSSEP